eukprot:m.218001 g.218001  ORF g.218001 m.218001 type:complete len:749 (+) comp15897_c0_seq4:426-2672(+)
MDSLKDNIVWTPSNAAVWRTKNPWARVYANVQVTRSIADAKLLKKCLGRIVRKYFAGYGTFLGVIRECHPDRAVVEVEYEDGDLEELYLDQMLEALMPEGTLPPSGPKDPDAAKWGFVWPPPTTSHRFVYDAPRQRKLSESAKQRLQLEATLARQREEARKLREERKKQQAELAAEKAKAKAEKAKAKAEKAKARAKAAKEKEKEKAKERARKERAKAKARQDQNVIVINRGNKRGKVLKTVRTPETKASKRRRVMGIQDDGRMWVKCEDCRSKHWSDENCREQETSSDDDDDDNDDDKKDIESLVKAPRKWAGSTTEGLLVSLKAHVAHAREANTPPTTPQPQQTPTSSHPRSSPTYPLDSQTMISESSSCDIPDPKQESSDGAEKTETESPSSQAKVCSANQASMVSNVYASIKRKLDITCGGDGYGITGNVTQASLSKLFEVMRTKCEMDESAWFIDLGHGMGRPSMHAAALHPHVKAAFGTEYNPQLYKQSMLALLDCCKTPGSECLLENPRVFFMDSNIKDFNTMNPFTHVYGFQIGMPDDVIDWIFTLIKRSRSVKYAVLYPHRAVTTKRLQQLGDIVHTQSMFMPGGNSYEANVIKVSHGDNTMDNIDRDVGHALEVLKDPFLYNEYLEQLGLVAALENEEAQIRMSRSKRKKYGRKSSFQNSPCLPDINLGLVRRVAVALGVSPAGDKVQILNHIREYVPVAFGLSMFAIGHVYKDKHVNAIIEKLLKHAPSRRQPEGVP